MPATAFLDDDANTSDILEHVKVGDIIVIFFGTMHADEKWAIQTARADVDAVDREWQAIHPTDDVDATGTDIAKWMGPRDKDRIFYFPVDKGFVYRVTKVYGPTASPAMNTSVTACWAERRTTLQR